MSFTAMHVVDESSALYGETLATLDEKNAMFLVSLSGTDERLMQTVYARHVYWVGDAVTNARFADVIHPDENGELLIDQRRFDDYIPTDRS